MSSRLPSRWNWMSRPRPPFSTAVRLSILAVAILGTLVHEVSAAEESVYQSINRRLVKITGAGGLRGLPPFGTGAIISAEGHILTVWNHVLDERVVTVTLPDGRKVDGQVVGADPELDVAVLKVDATDLAHFVLEDSIDVGTGTRVLAFSNMFRVAAGDEPLTVLHGVIAAKVKLQARKGVFEIPYKGPVYIVDAITNNSGAGGGVVVTRDGRLIALIGREVRNAQTNTWINYSVPISAIRDVVADIQAGRVRRGGEEEEDVDGRTPRRISATDFGLVLVPDVVPRTPAFIDRTMPGTPAADSGLRANDLVLFVNDELVPSCRALREELGKLKPGDPVRIVIRRGDELITLDWKTPERPQN